ncbi:hypothetical protein GCM10009754_83860 [Amycolatopsis minnesotensis]|uniref:Uncharacterized protein n=1 Tax=Amycolatopsis minnesotensis TaxID=337894 RepID=A0ABP5E6T9_9PSEU
MRVDSGEMGGGEAAGAWSLKVTFGASDAPIPPLTAHGTTHGTAHGTATPMPWLVNKQIRRAQQDRPSSGGARPYFHPWQDVPRGHR